MSIREKVFAAFMKEYTGHVSAMRDIRTLLEEESREGREIPVNALENGKIRAHTLKGASRAAGLPPVQVMAYTLELIFNRIKKQELTVDHSTLQLISMLLDAVEVYVAAADEMPGTVPDAPKDVFDAANRLLGTDVEAEALPRSAAKSKNKRQTPAGSGKRTIDREDVRRKILAVFLEEYKSHLESIRTALAAVDSGDTPPAPLLDEMFREAHTLKGAARAADIPAVQDLAHRLETLFTGLQNRSITHDGLFRRLVHRVLDSVEDYVTALQGTTAPVPPTDVLDAVEAFMKDLAPTDTGTVPWEPASIEPVPAAAIIKTTDSLRVSAGSLERLQKTADEIVTENRRHQFLDRHISTLRQLLSEVGLQWNHLFKSHHSELRQLEAHPEYSKIVSYLNYVNHHLQVIGREVRTLEKNQGALAQVSKMLGRSLQDDIRHARMIPAESEFQVFRKMVRDLARDQGKEVELRVEGFDVQADRLVFQRLKDPLMHILRNAVNHGIEPPEERTRKEKNTTGTVHLQIAVKDGRLSIIVTDDGQGIDYARIAQTAVKKKIVTKEEAENADKAELIQLLTQPGFSTAPMITEMAGRGMGLSVVKEAVNRLQGTFYIGSSPTGGSVIKISVPLTVSTTRILLVEVNRQLFGIPSSRIDRLLHVDVGDVDTLEGKPVIYPGPRPVHFLSLGYLLDIGETTLFSRRNRIPAIVLKAAPHSLAVAVHRFIGEEQVIVKDLPMPLTQSQFFTGAFIRADGSVALILNPTALATAFKGEKQAITLKTEEAQSEPESHKARILIVDDSITTRTLEKTILDAHGYDVYMAVDGYEAFQFLQVNDVDLVITDVAMPRMNGFALVEEMKKDNRLQKLPVIIVSSMDRKEDRERGLSLGADAYILKQKFEQQNLLETIQQII